LTYSAILACSYGVLRIYCRHICEDIAKRRIESESIYRPVEIFAGAKGDDYEAGTEKGECAGYSGCSLKYVAVVL